GEITLQIYRHNGVSTYLEPQFVSNFDIPGFQDLTGGGLLDIDNDGLLDLLFFNRSATRHVQLLNPGPGQAFALPSTAPTGFGQTLIYYAALFDFDLDGSTDVVTRKPDDDGALYLGDAALGRFGRLATALAIEAPTDVRAAVLACDFDRDAVPDVYLAGPPTEADRVFLGDLGSLTFTGTDYPGPPDDDDAVVTSASCGDLDHDGHVDLVLGQTETDRVVTLDGTGVIRQEALDLEDVNTLATSLADVDDDGDLDLFVVRRDNALFVGDTIDLENHLQIAMRATVRGCPDRRTRVDIGGRASVRDISGASVVGGWREISGGAGSAGTGWPVLHWGLDKAQDVLVDLAFRAMNGTPQTLALRPKDLDDGTSLHRLVVATDDPDGDGVLTETERRLVEQGVLDADPDGDGFVSWLDRDADGDGIEDHLEAAAGPCQDPVDSDLDGIPDLYDVDSDDDGLPDRQEVSELGTDPTAPDTDRGGRTDGDEVLVDGTDPLDPTDDRTDRDGDGLLDRDDPAPDDADADDDGLSDRDEILGGTDPLDADSDDDGLLDGTERGVATPLGDTDPAWFVADANPETQTDPNAPDTDGDGLDDGGEDADRNGRWTSPETDATRADTDGGGLPDGLEAELGTDPNDPSDDAPPRTPRGMPAAPPAGCGCAGSPGDPWVLGLIGALFLLHFRRR
ncbi:MAG: hypothetical protein AAF602_23875, partial [Myxococcota bacterium]